MIDYLWLQNSTRSFLLSPLPGQLHSTQNSKDLIIMLCDPSESEVAMDLNQECWNHLNLLNWHFSKSPTRELVRDKVDRIWHLSSLKTDRHREWHRVGLKHRQSSSTTNNPTQRLGGGQPWKLKKKKKLLHIGLISTMDIYHHTSLLYFFFPHEKLKW